MTRGFPTLASARSILRPFAAADADELFAVFHDASVYAEEAATHEATP